MATISCTQYILQIGWNVFSIIMNLEWGETCLAKPLGHGYVFILFTSQATYSNLPSCLPLLIKSHGICYCNVCSYSLLYEFISRSTATISCSLFKLQIEWNNFSIDMNPEWGETCLANPSRYGSVFLFPSQAAFLPKFTVSRAQIITVIVRIHITFSLYNFLYQF